ncbi:PD-(D/E)XK nuclease-like domain-containing protein [Limosilactobacillus ingluviei]|uniref:PD-(D/E)XK nuclease-like domain-containing protein n=1 Tax=Limosilactobacillus ingluviei TaxID=148604 RepID=UPI0024B92524|nr:PD-(D/E)XK nuclease-like domain-containing protein [Limosilactobacillus ingluviei]
MPTKLTPENYYSVETDWDYMSFSRFKDFRKCEAAALAQLKGEWTPKRDETPLLVGNYVHSYFESPEAHKQFVEAHKGKMISSRGKTAGSLKKDYKSADTMIKALEDDELFNYVYRPGEDGKEVIVTGTIGGHPWKGKIDSLNLADGYFCDLKTVDDIHKKHWLTDERTWGTFIEDRGYYMQLAIYRELIKQTFGQECAPYMFAVSKQAIPDKMAIDFVDEADEVKLQSALQDVLDHQDRIWSVMAGETAPISCGKCEYCRARKVLDSFVHASEIEVD